LENIFDDVEQAELDDDPALTLTMTIWRWEVTARGAREMRMMPR
jgi:hypothetical protein